MYKLDKRGQITIFIIIGLVLVLAMGMFFVLQNQKLDKQRPDLARILGEIPSEARPIYQFIYECIDLKVREPINVMGVQGGHLFFTSDYLKTEYGEVAYGIFEGKNTFITLPEMELQLESYMESIVTDCIKTSEFEKQGYTLTPSSGEIDVKIQSSQILFDIETEIKVEKRDFATTIKDFNINLESRLGGIHEVAKQIIINSLKNPDFVDLNFPTKFDFDISILPEDDENLIYSIQDKKITLDDNPYIFLFAIKFKKQFSPLLDVPKQFKLKDGDVFNYTFTVIDDDSSNFRFEDDSVMFDVINGSINFIPDVVGEFNITITVFDEDENFDSKIIKFEVYE